MWGTVLRYWSQTIFFQFWILSEIGPVWYVCLKTENCCLKTFVEIRVGEKVR